MEKIVLSWFGATTSSLSTLRIITLSMTLKHTALSIRHLILGDVMLSVTNKIIMLSVVMLNVVILSVVMLRAAMLNVVRLSVMAPLDALSFSSLVAPSH